MSTHPNTQTGRKRQGRKTQQQRNSVVMGQIERQIGKERLKMKTHGYRISKQRLQHICLNNCQSNIIFHHPLKYLKNIASHFLELLEESKHQAERCRSSKQQAGRFWIIKNKCLPSRKGAYGVTPLGKNSNKAPICQSPHSLCKTFI